MDPLQRLEDECTRSQAYPRTVLCTKTREHTLFSLQCQLQQRCKALFCREPEATINFWELRRIDEGYQPIRIAEHVALRRHFESSITQHRPDPRRRFMFIQAPHSRDPLSITFEMFAYAMTYLQVMPAFLELIFPFGRQHYTRGFHFSGFRSESRLAKANKGLDIEELRRSGIHLELCYNLKSVERTPDVNPWSIRQCSVYHRYDLKTERTTWIIVKGNSLVQDIIRSHTLRESTLTSDCQPQARSAFEATLDVHTLIAAWASEDWHWYISDLESSLQELTRPLLTAPFQARPSALPPLPEDDDVPDVWVRPTPTKKWSLRNVSEKVKRSFSGSTLHSDAGSIYKEKPVPRVRPDDKFKPTIESSSFRDLPRVQSLQEKANELLLVLTTNFAVLDQLHNHYKHFFAAADCPPTIKDYANTAISQFECELTDVKEKLTMQQSRVQALIHLVDERKAILNSVLQYQSLQASNVLAEKAQVSTEKMEGMTREMHEIARKTKVETVSMRIITLVTLFFLPGTFISTLMSTPIVNFSTNGSGFSHQNIGFGALEFFVVVSVPLVCLTFAAWYFVYRSEKRRERRQLGSAPDFEQTV